MGIKKLQSAMEYLMTYGWAILVIAVVMVALFTLGTFNRGGPNLPTTCIAQSGFVCANPIFSYATGNLVATIGQSTGTSWLDTNVVFVPSGVSTANPASLFSGAPYAGNVALICVTCTGAAAPNQWLSYAIRGITTTGQITVNVPVNHVISGNPPMSIGQSESGSLWVQYQTVAGGAGGPSYYARIATVTLKAQ